MSLLQKVYPEGRVVLREVGLRDGLQLVKTFPSTEAKRRWLAEEHAAGVRHFEVGSFLPAKTFAQFADVREMVRAVAALPGAHGVALVLNERGVNEALESGVGEIASVVSATEAHSQANARRSRESAIANIRRLCELRDAAAHGPIVHAAISMALGCSIAGAVDPNEVLRLVEKCLEAGVDAVGIADTVGYAGPKQVGDLTTAAVRLAVSMARSAASAVVPSRPARPAMSCSRTWCSCARARVLRPASTLRSWSPCARSCARRCRTSHSLAASPAPACPAAPRARRESI
jgi:hydroxymethylglutaryl-CoA lyase